MPRIEIRLAKAFHLIVFWQVPAGRAGYSWAGAVSL